MTFLPLAVLLIVCGWILLGAGAFVLALSWARKGESWRAVFDRDIEKKGWAAEDERRAGVLRKFARCFLLVGFLAVLSGYALRSFSIDL